MNMKNRAFKGLLFSVMLSLSAVLAGGCGADEAEDAIQTGAMQEEDTDSETDTGTAQDPGMQEDDTGGTGSGQGQSQEEESYEEVDEETKEELTTQMLQENDLDTSVVSGKRATKGCTFTVPDDFTEMEDVPGMYVTKRYPIDASTIYYVEMDKDISLQLMTEETFVEQTQNNLSQVYGMDIKVDLKSFERIEIGGYPAFRILCSYEVDGVELTQLECAINADKSYVITYSQTGDYDRMEEFEVSASTIELEY